MSINDLLTRLESVSMEAMKMTDPTANEVVDTIASDNKIQERGILVDQLNAELAAAGPLSYTDFNRLIIIHYQGSRTEENVQLARNQLAGELSLNTRGRAFLDCIAGGLEAPQTTRLTDSV
jgi:hypothetical protein